MQCNIALKATCAVADDGFSLDELVIRVQEVMESEGLAGIVALILALMQETLIAGFMVNRKRTPGYMDGCCETPHYQITGSHKRKRGIRTTLGNVQMTWRRVRCRNCRSVSNSRLR